MYIESCGDEGGPARIGRVTRSKTGRTLYYRKLRLERHDGLAGNYRDQATGDEYWVVNVKRGRHRRRVGDAPVAVDDDVRADYERMERGR